LFQLGLNGGDYRHLDFGGVFDCGLPAMLDSFKRASHHGIQLSTHTGLRFHARMETSHLFSANYSPNPSVAAELLSSGSRVDQRPLNELDTGDEKMHQVITIVKKVIEKEIPILIEGETGTGKEMLAKAIHQASVRHSNPFIAINCASIPEGLIEAELFGYEEGAFTGAKRKGVPGKILQANGGTLFLDEIGEMPLHLQARLLRVLQEREITPLGGGKRLPININLICATNRKLFEHVEQGHFREDLYYRINGLRVRLPALREREDIETLIRRILHQEHAAHVSLDPQVLRVFQCHPWRGNIRQLRNVLKAALAFSGDEGRILLHHLPEDFLDEVKAVPQTSQNKAGEKSAASIRQTEAIMIRQALNEHQQNVSLAARQLGISRATLYRKLKIMNSL
jgi:transcriptional regulator with PAS, ATPase and Fis domain